MVAYVDANGLITTEMPEPGKKKEIDIKKIVVSTGRKENTGDEVLTDRVEYFIQAKATFYKRPEEFRKVFFPYKNAFPLITDGSLVTKVLARGNRDLNAVKITPAQNRFYSLLK